MVSISQIAKVSGYAKSTVSRYINQSGYVSEEAGRVIQEVIEQLDYIPNQQARDLSLGKTHRIAVVVPHTKHPYFIELLRGLMDSALEGSDQLVFLPSDYQSDLELAYLEQLRAKAFDALVFTSRAISMKKIAEYSSYGRIVVLEETTLKGLSSVYIKRGPAYDALFSKLQQASKTKLALLFSRNDETSATYRETMRHAEQYFETAAVKTFGGLSTYDDAFQIFEILKAEPFDAIVANSDDLASALIQCFSDLPTPPLIVSQERQVSGNILGIPSIDHKAYQLGHEVFKAAVASDIQVSCIQSELVNHDSL
ncbi:LacI family DNA-binding transcriptional regulator [Streptococcus loxodontisalivarius]|uniref:DNA-binding LacI/PurR family transcriptional regulator n=1 Tax=Streptococcus loxodontisalivarius TaxID=1349415 RepID=A0ABS2PSA5_9STRE|nr:LacI family DNA-binding transcriptional regulator [Streptococcus loxodontisalivarius]MBM7642875.1 DNA-binding LacI/PurR family transcriptional regulator [Streptococcus loxodontisalivarius]